MGGALLARWTQMRPAGIAQFTVIDPATQPGDVSGVRFFSELSAAPPDIKPDVIVFAVKPQQMATLLPAYASRFGVIPLYLSIAAGKTLAWLAGHLGKNASIVRAMPNTPALIGEGMTALVAATHVPAAQKNIAEALMGAAGKTLWVEDEAWMDGVTAISGSGPAYVFLFMEALTHAAMECGLSEPVAVELVRQTVRGSALLAEKKAFSALRRQVTSPGGTTEAALTVLMKNNQFEQLLVEATKAAAKRAGELEK